MRSRALAPSRTNPEAFAVAVQHVTDLLENYASRGIFRGFSRGAATASRASYKIVWHRNREFELVFDARKSTLKMPSVLPAVFPEMFEHLKSWIAEQQSAETLEHRRIEPSKAT